MSFKTPPAQTYKTPTAQTFKIPAAVLAMGRLTDNESFRYAIDCVRIERRATSGQPVAIATDGRAMCAFTWKDSAESINAPVHVPGLKMNAMARAGLNGAAELQIREGEFRRIEFKQENGPLRAKWVESQTDEPRKFPKWQDVFRDWNGDADAVTVLIDAARLGRLCNVIAKLLYDLRDDRALIAVSIASPDRPLVMSGETPDGRRVVAALMPVEAGDADRMQPKPVWLAATREQPATATSIVDCAPPAVDVVWRE